MRSSDELISEVVGEVGLSDLGGDTFVLGLEALLESAARDADLDPEGRSRLETSVRRRVENRLRIEACYSREPALADLAVEGPVSIMGLPRTGTTALGDTLSLDGQFRPLRMWEQMQPCPPPVLADEHHDPRRLAYIEATAALLEQVPELRAMHIYEVDATIEDVELLGLEFRSQEFMLPVLGYHEWWRDADMTDAYRYHRRAAVLLQSRRPPNRWLIKSPCHCFHLDAIVAAYPDARFVMTHRDPVRAVPSAVSFITALYPPGTLAAHDLTTLGAHYAEHLRVGLERAIEARRRLGPDRFLDVHHHDLRADPLGAVERIYEFLGLDLTGPVRTAMARWHRSNSSGAHGVHRYTAEQFGLRDDQLRADFAFYTTEFDIRQEGP
jgi:hypothetical protein